MFAITSTRIVGLIAVVCAVVVAPQALAVPITDSNTATPTVVPVDAATGNDLSGFDLKAGFNTRESVKAAKKAAAIETASKALQRRSVAMEAAYRKLHPDAYRPAVQKSNKAAVWNFPSCIPSAAAEHDPYTYSGDPCTLSAPAQTVGTIGLAPAIETDVAIAVP